jgi:lactoylglutathione lyase
MSADHCGFQVRSLEAAIRFYTEKLSFTLETQAVNEVEQEAYAFLSRGTALLELIQDLVHEFVLPPLRKPFCPHYCLEVADLEQAVAELRAHKIPIVKGPLRMEQEETWVYFADPDHNILEYIQWFTKK